MDGDVVGSGITRRDGYVGANGVRGNPDAR